MKKTPFEKGWEDCDCGNSADPQQYVNHVRAAEYMQGYKQCQRMKHVTTVDAEYLAAKLAYTADMEKAQEKPQPKRFKDKKHVTTQQHKMKEL